MNIKNCRLVGFKYCDSNKDWRYKKQSKKSISDPGDNFTML